MDEKTKLALLNKYMEKYGMTNPYIKTALTGIILSEGSFTGKSENMNYSVSRLPEVWGTFSTTGKRVAKGTGAKYANDLAKKYAGKPKELANYIYGNRLGNKGRDTDDGYTYRGRGLNQLTGKGSYKKMGEKLGVDLVNNPELLNTDPDIQAHAAVRFLYDRIAKEVPKLVNKSSKYKEKYGKYVDFNNIDNLKDASFLLTSANAGLGNNPKQESFDKRYNKSLPYLNTFLNGNPKLTSSENTNIESTDPNNVNADNVINNKPITNDSWNVIEYIESFDNNEDLDQAYSDELPFDNSIKLDPIYQQALFGQVMFNEGGVVSPAGDPWEYKKENGKYLTRRKGNDSWITATGVPEASIKSKIFKEGSVPESVLKADESYKNRQKSNVNKPKGATLSPSSFNNFDYLNSKDYKNQVKNVDNRNAWFATHGKFGKGTAYNKKDIEKYYNYSKQGATEEQIDNIAAKESTGLVNYNPNQNGYQLTSKGKDFKKEFGEKEFVNTLGERNEDFLRTSEFKKQGLELNQATGTAQRMGTAAINRDPTNPYNQNASGRVDALDNFWLAPIGGGAVGVGALGSYAAEPLFQAGFQSADPLFNYVGGLATNDPTAQGNFIADIGIGLNNFTKALPQIGKNIKESFGYNKGGVIELELTDKQVEKYRKGGYVVEEIPMAEEGIEYKYKNRPKASYKKDNNNNWLIKTSNTGGNFVQIEDPSGERTAILNEQAIAIPKNNEIFIDPRLDTAVSESTFVNKSFQPFNKPFTIPTLEQIGDAATKKQVYKSPDLSKKFIKSSNRYAKGYKDYFTASEEEIKDIQHDLLNKGYNIGLSKADGIFGPATSNAYEDMISDKNLEVNTINRYFNKFNKNNRQEIKSIQGELIKKGFLSETTSDGKSNSDGRFGKLTKKAIEDYNTTLNKEGGFTFDNIPSTLEDKRCSAGMCKILENNKVPTTSLGIKYVDAWNMLENMNTKGNSDMVFNIYDDKAFNKLNSDSSESEIKKITSDVKKRKQTKASDYKVGDIVGIYWPGSEHHKETLNSITHNTHSGFVSDIKNGVPIITHNVGGKVKQQPYTQLQTGWISRPNSNVVVESKYDGSDYENVDLDKNLYSNFENKIEKKLNPKESKVVMSIMQRAKHNSKTIPEILNSSVDPKWLEAATFGITGVETGGGINAPREIKDLTTGSTKKILRGFAYAYKGKTDENISLGVGKVKLKNIDNFAKKYFDVNTVQDLADDNKTVDIISYQLVKNYEIFKDYAKQYPQLKLKDQDVKNMAILAYNQGTNILLKTGRNTTNPKSSKEQLAALKKLYKGTVADISSTNYKYLPESIKDVAYNAALATGYEKPGEYYISKVNRYIDEIYNTGDKKYRDGGYQENSPDVNNDYNIIPSGNITMKETDGRPLKKGPILGIDNLGTKKLMRPGGEYKFPGNTVFEVPLAQKGIEVPKQNGGTPAMTTRLRARDYDDRFKNRYVPFAQEGYSVQSGDTFLGIGNKYGISPKDLIDANPGIDIEKLSLNQSINIPKQKYKPKTIFEEFSLTPKDAPKVKSTKINTSKKDFKLLDNYFNELMIQENSINKGIKGSKYYPYDAVENNVKKKKTKDIGYGHKILPGEDFSKGLTKAEAITLMKKDYKLKNKSANNFVNNLYGKDTFRNLSPQKQIILTDYQYNVGLEKFPKFLDAVITGDTNRMLNEYERFSDKEPLKQRNEFTKNWINTYLAENKNGGEVIELTKAQVKEYQNKGFIVEEIK